MASIVPKIKIGLGAAKREKHNLSFDCSTTANIGSVQPTMCREMIPNSKFSVKIASLVRLASMPVPTFGRMSLRHYHTFVPYVDLYQPFDALMSGQHYKGYHSATFIPSKVPFFTMENINSFIRAYSDISIAPVDKSENPIYITVSNVSWNGTIYHFSSEEHKEDMGYDEDSPDTYEQAVIKAQQEDMNELRIAWSAVREGCYFGAGGAHGSHQPLQLPLRRPPSRGADRPDRRKWRPFPGPGQAPRGRPP